MGLKLVFNKRSKASWSETINLEMKRAGSPLLSGELKRRISNNSSGLALRVNQADKRVGLDRDKQLLTDTHCYSPRSVRATISLILHKA